MNSCQYIEEYICFSNGGTNLHIHTIAQGRPEDNQVEFLQGPHEIVNRPKNIVLNNIRRFTMEHIGAANGLINTKDAANNLTLCSRQDLEGGEILLGEITCR